MLESNITYYVRTTSSPYISTMVLILSTLGVHPHGFAFGIIPKGLIPMTIVVSLIYPISSPYLIDMGPYLIDMGPYLTDVGLWLDPHTVLIYIDYGES